MFDDCKTFADLKHAYKRAARKAHPDMGGSTEEMQAVNAAYEQAVKRIQREGEKHSADSDSMNSSTGDSNTRQETAEDMAEYAEILQKLMGLDGIEIELCGTWLWISGATFAHKQALKSFGCKWSSNKKCWYWYTGEWSKIGKKRYTMDEIRDMHGSEKIHGKPTAKLYTIGK